MKGSKEIKKYRRNVKSTVEEARELLYSMNNASITGINIMSSLKPQVNSPVDRTNVYSLKTSVNWTKETMSRRKWELKNAANRVVKQEVQEDKVYEDMMDYLNANAGVEKWEQKFLNNMEAHQHSKYEVQEIPQELNEITSYIKKLLKEGSDKSAKFLYFNVKKGSTNPYDFELTRFEERCIRRHYTISSKVVTRYDNEIATEVSTVKEWLIERELYNKVMKLAFFNNFHRWKLMNTWRRKVWLERKEKIVEELEDKLFFLEPNYRDYLLAYKKKMQTIAKLKLIDINKDGDTNSLNEFITKQEKKQKALATKVKDISEKSRSLIKELFRKSLDRLREKILSENELVTGSPPVKINKSKLSNARLSKIALAMKELGFPDNMNYGHRSFLKRECTRFIRLGYLLDYCAMKALGDAYMNTIKEVSTTFSPSIDRTKDINEVDILLLVKTKLDMTKEIPSKDIIEKPLKDLEDKMTQDKDFDLSGHTLIQLDEEKEDKIGLLNKYKRYKVMNIARHWIALSPSNEQFYNTIMKFLMKGMKNLRKFERWSRHSELMKYADILEDWDEIIGARKNIKPCEETYLNPLESIGSDSLYINHKEILKNTIDDAYEKCNTYLCSFNKFLNICWRNNNADLKLLFDDRLSGPTDLLVKALNLFDWQKKHFAASIPETATVGFIKIDCQSTRKALLLMPEECMERMRVISDKIMAERVIEVERWVEEARRRLDLRISVVENFVKQRMGWNEIADEYKEKKEKIDLVTEIYDAWSVFGIYAPKEDKLRHSKTLHEMIQLNQLLANVSDQQELNLEKIRKKLKEQLIPKLHEKFQALMKEIEDESLLRYSEYMEDLMRSISLLEEKLAEYLEEHKKYNDFQEKLNVEVAQFEIVNEVNNALALRKLLWKSLKEWEELTSQWTEQKFISIDSKVIEQKAEEYSEIALKLQKELPENEVSKDLKRKVEEFKEIVPIIRALRNEILKKEHWKTIRELLNEDFNVFSPNFTLQSLMKFKAISYKKEIEEISTQATRENLLELKITSINDRWKEKKFILKPYKVKGTYILENISEIIQLIDQSFISITTMLEDKYVLPLLSQIESWKKTLRSLELVIEELSLLQSQWKYLVDVFSSTELRKELITEVSRFEGVDKFFVSLMQKMNKSLNPIRFIKGYRGDLLEQIKHNNKSIEEIKKSLIDHLDCKRKDYPRFYFLSTDEILELMLNGQNFVDVKKFLPKIFDCVEEIELNENNDMMGAISIGGERLKFCRALRLKENIVNSLQQVQNGIKEALNKYMKLAISDYDDIDRKEWLSKYPCQVVLAISQIVWCNATESTISEQASTPNGMLEWYEEIVKEIQQAIQLLKHTTTKYTTSTMLISYLHSRDIIEELVIQNVSNINDYNWQRVLRLYWEEDDNMIPTIFAKALMWRLDYGEEYIGLPNLSVSTGITDRVWVSIANALNDHIAIALIGKRDIGKTETIKGLARTIGMRCVMLSCDKGTNYKMLSKVISGTVQEGIWVCIKSLELLEYEVLSVLSTQLNEIKRALEKKVSSIGIDEREIPIKSSCGIFTTMNKECLEKMKFVSENVRVISLMQPDVNRIIEIMLLAKGFSYNKGLTERVIMFYKLLNESLSDYEFGLRKIKRVINIAETLSLDEFEAIYSAIRMVVKPEMNERNMVLFKEILNEVFPDIKDPKLENITTVNSLFNDKLNQLLSLIEISGGVIITGGVLSGKTKVLYAAHEAHTDSNNIKLSFINPNALTINELYGYANLVTQEWTNGLVPNLIHNIKDKLWLIFDGDINNTWASTINTALTSNAFLSLGNNEKITIGPEIKIFFECDSLNKVSPAIINRCGIVYMPEDTITCKMYIEQWYNKVYSGYNFEGIDLKDYILFLFEDTIERSLNKVRSTFPELMSISNIRFIASICNIMKALITNERISIKKLDKKRFVIQVYCFAFAWGIGGSLDESSKSKMELLVRGLFDHNDIPVAQTVFDYYIDPKKGIGFKLWADICPSFTYTNSIPFHQVIVPTIETVRQEYFIDLLTSRHQRVYIFGQSSSGKSTIVNYCLDKLEIQKISTHFIYRADSNYLQHSIERRLQRNGKNNYGTTNKKRATIYIDDAHLALTNIPSTELLRQMLNQKGWYDRTKYYWKNINNISMISIGKNIQAPLRFMRHFVQLHVPEMNRGEMENVFKNITCEILKDKGYLEALQIVVADIVSTSIDFYIDLKKKGNLVRDGYKLTLRDLKGLFESMTIGSKDIVVSVEVLVQLWAHELKRVFNDALQLDEEEINKCVQKVHKAQLDLTSIWIFNSKNYIQVRNIDEYEILIEKRLKDYIQNTNEAHNLILFKEMLELLVKIVRGLEQSRGRVFIIGNRGIGKSSIAKLAIYLQDLTLKEIEPRKEITAEHVTHFLKALLQSVENPLCLLLQKKLLNFTDQALETLTAFINDIELSELLTVEEIDKITNKLRLNSKEGKSYSCFYKSFIKQIQRNVKVVIVREPNKELKKEMKKFPSLFTSFNFIWANNWSSEELYVIGQKFLPYAGEELLNKLRNACEGIHSSVLIYGNKLNILQQNSVQVEPVQYIELFTYFAQILEKNKQKIMQKKEKLIAALGMIKGSKSIQESGELGLKLKEKVEILEQIQSKITDVQNSINIKEETLALDKQQFNEAQRKLKMKGDKIEAELNIIKPEVTTTMNEVSQYDKKSLMEIKSTSNPTSNILLVMETVMTLLQEKIDWASIRATVTDANEFINKLVSFPERIDNIPEAIIKKTKGLIAGNASFNTDNLTGKAGAVKPLARWVKVMLTYYEIYMKTAPQRKNYEKEKEALIVISEELSKKAKELNELKEELLKLKNEHGRHNVEKEKIAEEVVDTKSKSVRFEEFLSIFTEQEKRWANSLKELTTNELNVIGDSLLEAAFIVYAGQFQEKDRSELIVEWRRKIWKQDIHIADAFNLAQSKPQNHFNTPLFKTQFYKENSMIISNSFKWPLLLDPQLIATQWIKSTFKRSGLITIKVSQRDYIKILENAITLGKPVLIEDLEEIIDPLLNPLLYKKVLSKGNKQVIFMNGKEIEYDSGFSLFITARECVQMDTSKVCIVNFEMGPSSLEEELFEALVAKENIDKEYNAVSKELSFAKKGMNDLEEKILNIIAGKSLEELLDDENDYENIKIFYKNYEEMAEKLKVLIDSHTSLYEKREEYRTILAPVSVLYSVATNFAKKFPQYRFSLDVFKEIYNKVITANEEEEEKMNNLTENIMKELCQYIESAMDKTHRLVFAFIIYIEILKSSNKSLKKTLNYLMIDTYNTSNSMIKCIDSKGWVLAEVIDKELPQFKGLIYSLSNEQAQWMAYGNNEEDKAPGKWNKLMAIDRLLLCRVFYKRRLETEMIKFVQESGLPLFIDPAMKSLEHTILEGRKDVPIVLQQSKSNYCAGALQELADVKSPMKNLIILSIGQEQAQSIKRTIQTEQIKGEWVLLENCNLLQGNKELDSIMEQLKDPKAHENFRLFLSNVQLENTTSSFIENSIKFVLNKPEGIKEQLKVAYKVVAEFMEGVIGKLMLGLILFHVILAEVASNKGFEQEYEFRLTDLKGAAKIVKTMTEEQEGIPWSEIQFAVGEIHYCERIVDQMDKQKIIAVFKELFNECILHSDYSPLFCDSYKFPDASENYEEYLNDLPTEDPPELFAIAKQNWLLDRNSISNNTLMKILQTYYSYDSPQHIDHVKILIDRLMEITPELLNVPVCLLITIIG